MAYDTNWDHLLLRLRNVCQDNSRGRGYGVIHLRIVVRDGRLMAWYEPRCEMLEPASVKRVDDEGLVDVLLSE